VRLALIMHRRFKILDVDISAVDLSKACHIVDDLISKSKNNYICVAPVSTLIHSQEDERFKNIVNSAAMVTPDGMPLVWLARMKGYKDVKRTYGPDLMLALCEYGLTRNYRHYLLGGSIEALKQLAENLKLKYPNLNVAGTFSPPFKELTDNEQANMIDTINKSDTDILWVGLGSPKQEFWMKENCDKLNVPVMIGVGAAFDFLSGLKPQAPLWMQRFGLEWLFRLFCEPRRLARRYFIGNCKFILLIIKSFFKGELKKDV